MKKKTRIRIFSKEMILLLLLYVMIISRLLYEGAGIGIWNGIQILFVTFGILLIPSKLEVLLISKPLRTFTILMLYIWFLSVFSIKSLDFASIYYFIMIPYAGFLTIVVYYVFLLKNPKNYAFFFILLFIIISALVILKGNASYLAMDDVYMGINSYYLVLLIPLVLIPLKTPWSFIPFIVAIVVVAFTNKRAGMIAVVLEAAFYIMSLIKKKKNILPGLIGVVLASIIVIRAYDYIAEAYGLDILIRLQGIEEDGGSGRMGMWKTIMQSFYNSDIASILFGHGNGSAHALLGHQVHNDFLQLMYDFGFLSLILYVIFYIRLFIEANIMRKKKYPYATLFLMSIITSLFISLTSFLIIEPRVVTCSALTWGVILAGWYQYKNNLLVNG